MLEKIALNGQLVVILTLLAVEVLWCLVGPFSGLVAPLFIANLHNRIQIQRSSHKSWVRPSILWKPQFGEKSLPP